MQCSNPRTEIMFVFIFLLNEKEKHDNKAIQEESRSTLVDPALASVLGVAKDRQDLNSEEASSTPGAKAKKSSEESSSRNAKDKKTDTQNKSKAVKKHVSLARVAKPSTNSKLVALDQKWLEHFSRLGAILQPARARFPPNSRLSSQASALH